jgi:Predicted Peptidoglycan domain
MNHRTQIAAFILDCEARKDKAGNLAVYDLPEADGGGTYEVAGINDRYHPEAANQLRRLILRDQHDEARSVAIGYLAAYTDVATNWAGHPSTEAFLRDCVFNRGPKGALRILQIAIRVPDDGKYGPKTKAANAKAHRDPPSLLLALRRARETYEIRIAPPVGKRAKFWKGLVNRWEKALKFSQSFL